ncbi:DUF1800 family protein [Falsihalocynthiibacter sp. BN13B15]|uniref:DUF1800 domain-containing protein n=1 Tax=Falsihalocynthiibacter sp. BN13B15 TaxID=3240871 RepID=UPI00350FD6E9
MAFDPEIAAIRFGTGLSPRFVPPHSLDAVFAELTGPDVLAKQFPIASFESQRAMILDLKRLSKLKKKNRGTELEKEAQAQFSKRRKSMARANTRWFNASLARYIASPHGFRERLVRFWADHFTVVGNDRYYRHLVTPFVEDAIRPNINGRFSDLLIASSLHPLMLHYLDQNQSIGPNSYVSRKRKNVGLNENLAREILELHTLGVGGGYSQKDVRQFAELLAGTRFTFADGMKFIPQRAEPGTEEILGKTYRGPRASLKSIHHALEDFARRPETASHLAQKMAVHFVSDTPDPALVGDIRGAYLASDGELLACYQAMLSHPAAWGKKFTKAMQPFDFVATSLRALDVDVKVITRLNDRLTNLSFQSPLSLMGQPWERPNGPDGWPENAEQWFTPQGLAARIQWAMMVPQAFAGSLANSEITPLQVAQNALGDRLTPTVQFVANSAETKWEGIGLVLASPDFQRR